MLSPIIVALVLLPLSSAQACSERTDCAACTGDGDGDSVCSWCFSTGVCQLAYSRAEPKLSDWIAGPGSCDSHTTEASTCECRPDTYTDCQSCTNNRVGCVWVKKATTFAYTTVSVPLFGDKTSVASQQWSDICMAGDGIKGPTLPSAGIHAGGIRMVFNSTSDSWCWGQCAVEGPAFAGILIAVCILVPCLLCCALRLLCPRVCTRKPAGMV